MNRYDATHVKNFPGNRTARDYIASTINDSWIYTYQWDNEKWVEQAKEDLKSRINYAKQELIRLEAAEYILHSIED